MSGSDISKWFQFSSKIFFSSSGNSLEYLNTILEVYADSEDGEPACSQFEDWSIEFGQTPNTNWWNDDPEGDETCDTNDQSSDGEETHAVLMVPTGPIYRFQLGFGVGC